MRRLHMSSTALSYKILRVSHDSTKENLNGEILKIRQAEVQSETYDQLCFKKLRNLTIVSTDTTIFNKSWRFPVLYDNDRNECYALAYLFCNVNIDKLHSYVDSCLLSFHADADGYIIEDDIGTVSWALIYTNSHLQLDDANVLYDYPQQLYRNGEKWDDRFKLYTKTHDLLNIIKEEEDDDTAVVSLYECCQCEMNRNALSFRHNCNKNYNTKLFQLIP